MAKKASKYVKYRVSFVRNGVFCSLSVNQRELLRLKLMEQYGEITELEFTKEE